MGFDGSLVVALLVALAFNPAGSSNEIITEPKKNEAGTLTSILKENF